MVAAIGVHNRLVPQSKFTLIGDAWRTLTREEFEQAPDSLWFIEDVFRVRGNGVAETARQRCEPGTQRDGLRERGTDAS